MSGSNSDSSRFFKEALGTTFGNNVHFESDPDLSRFFKETLEAAFGNDAYYVRVDMPPGTRNIFECAEGDRFVTVAIETDFMYLEETLDVFKAVFQVGSYSVRIGIQPPRELDTWTFRINWAKSI